MRRAMHVLNGEGPQEGNFHDHPFFGQIFLASILYPFGYQNQVDSNDHSIESLYQIPRILMGLLAVFDTFLIYKIAQKKYNSKIGIFASLLFAVMPITWITRRILLDSMLLPFVLLAILFALYSKDSSKKHWFILLSGVFLGLAIFTKIPAFTMIPFVSYIIYSQNKNKKLLVVFLIPVFLLPMIWPGQSLVSDQFDNWKKDVLWQSQRQNAGIQKTAMVFAAMDPVLFGFGIAGIVYSAIRKNLFVLLWMIPFVVFLSTVGFAQYFHWMIVLPAFCLVSSLMIADIGKSLKQEKLKQALPLVTIIIIASFGLTSTVFLITTNVTDNQFEAANFAMNYAKNHNSTILAGPHYTWVFKDMFGIKNTYPDYTTVLFRPIPEKFVLMADPHLQMDLHRGPKLEQIYNSSITIRTFDSNKSNYDVYQYPYSNLGYNTDAGIIEIKIPKNLSN